MSTYRNTTENIVSNIRGNVRPDEEDWPSPPVSSGGSILLEDNVSIILLEDGISEILLE